MTIGERAVAVKQLPQVLSGRQRRIFLCEVETCMHALRPRLVLDCSNVRQLNKSVIHLLLSCLEEAMKRNGDVKLAALPAGAARTKEFNGVSRLFDIYDTTADAVNSFHRPSAGTVSRHSSPALP